MNHFKGLLLVVAVIFGCVFTINAATAASTSDDVKKGEAVYNAKCAKCHGAKGVGTKSGPPLIHKFYHPNHHSDVSFYWAVERGVRAHHWNFGDMPKVDGVSKDDTALIIKYVRAIQKQAGLF
ncbi:MAG: cytochrome c [Nitrospirota bacterium]|nr:cytochrome c [Nitrospirota bacterium]